MDDGNEKLVDRESRQTVGETLLENPRIACRDVNVYYGDKHAIRHVTLDIGRNEVIAMIGPSGCGKSTFLRCLNRMNDTIEGCRVTGDILLDGSISTTMIDVVPLRAKVGMVFQKPNPFPEVHLRQHRLRPQDPRPGHQQNRAGRSGGDR
jgi:phosphate transport system ATP-binding protein